MVVGSLETDVEEAQNIPKDLPHVVNDLDIPDDKLVDPKDREEYLSKVSFFYTFLVQVQVRSPSVTQGLSNLSSSEG